MMQINHFRKGIMRYTYNLGKNRNAASRLGGITRLVATYSAPHQCLEPSAAINTFSAVAPAVIITPLKLRTIQVPVPAQRFLASPQRKTEGEHWPLYQTKLNTTPKGKKGVILVTWAATA